MNDSRFIKTPGGPGIPKESQKSLPGPGPKSVRNSLKTVSGVSKQSILRLRRLFRDCFGHFLDPGVGRPRETLLRLFRDSGPGGPTSAKLFLKAPELRLHKIDSSQHFEGCKCILKIIPGKIGQAQLNQENACLRAENCNCMSFLRPSARYPPI